MFIQSFFIAHVLDEYDRNTQADAISLLYLRIAVLVLNACCKSFLNTDVTQLYGERTDSGGPL